MINTLKNWFNLKRDNNYYAGLLLLQIGIATIFWYLIFDAFEPVSFFITFAICGWGFTLLWKSDNDYRFLQVQQEMIKLAEELQESKNKLAQKEKAYSPLYSETIPQAVAVNFVRPRRRKLKYFRGCQ